MVLFGKINQLKKSSTSDQRKTTHLIWRNTRVFHFEIFSTSLHPQDDQKVPEESVKIFSVAVHV